MKNACIFLLATFFSISLSGQTIKSVLFLGNSYTYFNGTLPEMLDSIAASKGNFLIHDMNAPGGYTLEGHSTNAISLEKIQSGGWDYVVLQDQSQRPSFPPTDIDHQVLPFADSLNQYIHQYNPTAETMFFMTWGKENGDVNNCDYYPILCTYNGNQKRLTETYIEMSRIYNTSVSPVGVAWKVLRDSLPGINLYAGDGSHPSIAGTYLSACVFYASIFQESCDGSYFPEGISPSDAQQIQYFADQVVFNGLSTWNDNFETIVADFNYSTITPLEIEFTNISTGSNTAYWNFGDGGYDIKFDVVSHSYQNPGAYTVTHIAYRGWESDTITEQIVVGTVGLKENHKANYNMFPNPATNTLIITGKDIQSVEVFNIFKELEIDLLFSEKEKAIIDISNLTKGVYIVIINNEDYLKVVKN